MNPTAMQKSTQARDILAEETDMYFKQDQDIDVTLENIDTRINAADPGGSGGLRISRNAGGCARVIGARPFSDYRATGIEMKRNALRHIGNHHLQ